MTWLERFLKITEAAESPRQYFYWAGLSAISGAVGNRVYLDKHLYKLYPNIYAILIGKSGLRKSLPISIAKKLVDTCKSTRVISGRASIQAIITELSRAKTQEHGEIIKDAIGYLSSSEFASFIIQDPSALTILTDLYDGAYHDGDSPWVNNLKGSGRETLNNICITMIGASNPIHFREAVPGNAVGGGFIARTMLVYAHEKGQSNSLTRPTAAFDLVDLQKDLVHISKTKGSFIWTPEAQDAYDSWYYNFNVDNDPTGTAERLHDHILKVAMLLSLSRNTALQLLESDIKEAISLCMDCLKSGKRVTEGKGKNQLAEQCKLMIEECLNRPPDYKINRKDFLSLHWGACDAIDLDKVVNTLEQAKILQSDYNSGKPYYQLTKLALAHYLKAKQNE